MNERIKMLTDMLFENIELLESYDKRVEDYRNRKQEWLSKNPDRKEWTYSELYPCVGTSKTNIKNIATLLRKELLNL